jgi:hypothetical protein
LVGDLDANGMEADVTGAGAAVAIAIVTGYRTQAAAFQRIAKDIGLPDCHGMTFRRGRSER